MSKMSKIEHARTVARCDRCDSALHATQACPHYRRPREDRLEGSPENDSPRTDAVAPVVLTLRRVPIPGDGNCLFTALAVQVGMKHEAQSGRVLRRVVAKKLRKHAPTIRIASMSLEQWIRADAQVSLPAYCQALEAGQWGGGIELALFAHHFDLAVDVFQPTPTAHRYARVARFAGRSDRQHRRPPLRLLYLAGSHYDALLPFAGATRRPKAAK